MAGNLSLRASRPGRRPFARDHRVWRLTLLVLLSPSKTQDFKTDAGLPGEATAPRLIASAERVIAAMRAIPRSELHRRLKVTPRLRDVVDAAIDGWSGDADAGLQAAFAYTGETYRGLGIRSLEAAALARAQGQVRILSALYGAVRPLDLIEPYRLDFGCSLQIDGARSLYEFWRRHLTDHLARDIHAHGARAVVNLASAEFARAVDLNALGVPVITPDFRQREGDTLKRVTVFSKQARGSMARWVVSRTADPGTLPEFDADGYRYEPSISTPDTPVFVR